MESMTDWAFSWPISVGNLGVSAVGCDTGGYYKTEEGVSHVGSSL